jgi:hypothetical protein
MFDRPLVRVVTQAGLRPPGNNHNQANLEKVIDARMFLVSGYLAASTTLASGREQRDCPPELRRFFV